MPKTFRLIIKESIQSTADTMAKIKEKIKEADGQDTDIKLEDIYIVKNNDKYDIMWVSGSNGDTARIASMNLDELPEADLKELGILREKETESVVRRVDAEKITDEGPDVINEETYVTLNDGRNNEDVDYIIQDVTELEDVTDEDVEAPSIDGLLSLVNESLSTKYGNAWGYMKAHSIAKKESLQYAIIDIVTPSILKENKAAKMKDTAVSKTIILESIPNSKLVNFKVNTLAGTTRFSQKTNDPAKVFSRWLESEYLYDEMVKDFQKKIEARQAELKDSTEAYLKENPELANRINVLKAQAKLLKDAKMFEEGKNELVTLMYGVAAEFPANTNVKTNDKTIVKATDIQTQDFDTIDAIVELLFGKEYVKEPSKEEKEIAKENKKVIKENAKADALIRDYFTHKISSLGELHNRLEKLFDTKKAAVEYLADNEAKIKKSLKEGYESFKIGEIEGTFNPETMEAMYSIPADNVKDKKINLSKIPSVETPYNTETIIKDYVEKNFGLINAEEEPTTDATPEVEVQNDEEVVEEAADDTLPTEPNKFGEPTPAENKSEEEPVENQSETGEASFFKVRQSEPVDIETLQAKMNSSENTQTSSYIVVEERTIPKEEMEAYLSDLSKPQSFLQNAGTIDRKNYPFNVIKLKADGVPYTLLVDPVGYDYGRYVAIVQ